jgi:hypothetical protein
MMKELANNFVILYSVTASMLSLITVINENLEINIDGWDRRQISLAAQAEVKKCADILNEAGISVDSFIKSE